jgi:hypothetical protein
MPRYLLGALALAVGCVPAYVGGARPFAAATFAREPGWVSVSGVPELRQRRELDCGPTAVAMVLGFWGRHVTIDNVRDESTTPDEDGVEAGTLRDIVRAHGLVAFLFEGTVDDLEGELGAGRPVVVVLAKRYSNGAVYAHYEVVAGLHRARGLVVTVDPGRGWSVNTLDGFMREWEPTQHLTLVVSATELGTASARSPTPRYVSGFSLSTAADMLRHALAVRGIEPRKLCVQLLVRSSQPRRTGPCS